MAKLKLGVYETFYGNAAAWDGRVLLDLDMMKVVPVESITFSTPPKFIRRLEEADRDMIRTAVGRLK